MEDSLVLGLVLMDAGSSVLPGRDGLAVWTVGSTADRGLPDYLELADEIVEGMAPQGR